MIRIRGVTKSFGSQVVLRGIDLDIATGESVAVVGPSGTGKSVLLKAVTGLMPIDSGEVFIDGESITRSRNRANISRTMGILFQGAALLDSLTVRENVEFPLRYHRTCSQAEIIRRAEECINEVGLSECLEALPGEISMGMRKRVGIARALVTQPKILLFDEPNTGLDPEVGQDIYDLIKDTHRRFGFTTVVISHEIPEVFYVCNRVVMLYQGKVHSDCSSEEFIHSTDPVLRQFVTGSVSGPIKV